MVHCPVWWQASRRSTYRAWNDYPPVEFLNRRRNGSHNIRSLNFSARDRGVKFPNSKQFLGVAQWELSSVSSFKNNPSTTAIGKNVKRCSEFWPSIGFFHLACRENSFLATHFWRGRKILASDAKTEIKPSQTWRINLSKKKLWKKKLPIGFSLSKHGKAPVQ